MRKWLIVLLMIPALARAEFYTGNDLYNKQTDNESALNRMLALGYIMGVYDVGVRAIFCPGRESGITAGQLNDMVKNWMYANPQHRHQSAEKLVLDIFKQTWPCANRNNRSAI